MAAKLKPMKNDAEIAAVPVDQPVLVVLEPPATSSEGAAEPDTKEPAVRREDADDGVRVLKEQLEASKEALAKEAKAAADARALAAERERELAEARAQSADNEADAVASGLSAAQAAVATAKAAYKAAFEGGDAEALADAQEKMAMAAADVREFERANAALTERKTAPEPRAPKDINEVIDRMAVLPTEQVWLKAHPDALLDPGRKVELDAAYIKATRKGIVRGTPKYFEFIEREMGYGAGDDADQNEGDTAMVSAPVTRESRSSMSGQPNVGNRIELSPEQRAFAKTLGISEVEYAKQVRNLQLEKRAHPEKYASRG